MADLQMMQGDLLPVLSVTLLNPDLSVKDLTGATVQLLYKSQAVGGTLVTRTMTSASPLTGVATYSWVTGDTSTVGTFDWNVRVTVAGNITTYPNTGHRTLKVTAKLA